MISEKKNVVQTEFERKKILQGNTRDTMALYVRGKNSITRDLEEKNSYVNDTGP